MKKFLILMLLLLGTTLFAGTDYSAEPVGTSMPNLLFIDNVALTGISASQLDVVDGEGDEIGFSISTASIRFDTGYKLEWVDADMFIYNHAADGLTIDADVTLLLLGSTEIDLTSALVDINVTNFTLNGAIATTGALTHVGTMTISSTLDITGDLDSDGITNLDVTDIDGALQVDAAVTFGISGVADDVIFHSDTATEEFTWDATNSKLVIDGINGQNALEITDGDVLISDNLVVTIAITAATFAGDLTGKVDLNAGNLILDLDADTKIISDTDDEIDFYVGNAEEIYLTSAALYPKVDDGTSLGGVGEEWHDLWIDGTAYIDKLVASGDVGGTIDNTQIGVTTEVSGRFSTIEAVQTVIFNDAQADYDFRVETNNYDFTIIAEGSSDNVGIGDGTPDAKLHINDRDASADVTVLKIERISGSPANADETRIGFYYTDDNSDQEEFARMSVSADDVANDNEKGSFQFAFQYRSGSEIPMVETVKLGKFGIAFNGTPQTISGAGNITTTEAVTQITTTGANAYTISAGLWEGQVKYIYHIVDGGAATLATGAGATIVGTSIVLTDDGEGCILQWDSVNSQWFCIGMNATFTP